MKITRDLGLLPKPLQHAALAIGKFDGMHRGHHLILETLKHEANKRSIPTIALTFDPLPIQILQPDLASFPLTTLEEKISIFQNYNIDALIICPTDQNLLAQTAPVFFERVIKKNFATDVIVEGENFFFGHNREGTPQKLKELCAESKINLIVVPTMSYNGKSVSSSQIRLQLQNGNIEIANTLLGRPYRLTGKVVKGEQRGRILGFPTANLGKINTIVPQTGLYTALAEYNNRYYGVSLHIGANPTFGESQLKIEAFLIDFKGDLYGQNLSLRLISKLRDVIRFESVEALLEQMRIDIIETKKFLTPFLQTQ